MANPPSLIMSYFGSNNNNGGATTEFTWAIVQTNSIFSADEVGDQSPWVAGTATKLWCRVTTGTSSGSSTMVLRKNAADGTMSVSIPQASTGAFTDAVNQDNISNNDLVCYGIATGDVNIVFSIFAFTFVATTAGNTVTKLGATPGGNFGVNSTSDFATPSGYFGHSSANQTEANSKLRFRKAFTAKNLAFVQTNASSGGGSISLVSRKNGANGALTLSMSGVNPPPPTKLWQDTAHSDSLAVGDDYCIEYNVVGSYNPAVGTFSIDYVSTNGDCIFACGADNLTQFNTSTTNYFGLSGSLDTGQTSETAAQVKVNSAFVFDQLICNVVGTNGITGASTFSLRANGSDVIAISIPSQTNGIFNSPLQTTYQAATSDLMNYKIVTAGTGTNLKISFMSVYGNASAAPGAAGPMYQHFSNKLSKVGQQAYNAFGGQLTVFG